jgi:hypothetical protein
VRNNPKSHRSTEANAKRTAELVNEYLGVRDLRMTWDEAPMAMQCRNHGSILKLRARERKLKNYLDHRATPDSDLA